MCITTDTGTVRLVERCGKFSHITAPGLSFMLCCIDSASEPLSMRLQQLEVSCETKTKDNVFTNVKVRHHLPLSCIGSCTAAPRGHCSTRDPWPRQSACHAALLRCALPPPRLVWGSKS